LRAAPRLRMIQPHDDRLTRPVQVRVAYRVAHRALGPEPSEDPFKVAEAVDRHRRVRRATTRATNERGDGCRHTNDRANPAGDFLDLDARIRKCGGHSMSF